MECLLFLPCGFSTSLYFPKTLTKEIPTQKVDNRKLRRPVTSITAVKVVAQKCWDRGIYAQWSCHHHVVIQSRSYCELVSCHYNVSCAPSPMVISGYWMGPDIEDGWGFVEAVVNKIF